MSVTRPRAAADCRLKLAGPSAATCVSRVFFFFLALPFIVEHSCGAGAIKWGFDAPGAAEPPVLSFAEGTPSSISPPVGGQTAPIELSHAPDDRRSLPLESLPADLSTRNPKSRRHSWSSIGSARPQGPTRRYSLPPRLFKDPEFAEDTSTRPQFSSEQPPPQQPGKRKGFFRRAYGKARQWSSKAGRKLKELWQAFKRRLRRAGKAAGHTVAKLYKKLPKLRGRRAQAPGPPQHPLRAPSAEKPTKELHFKAGLGRRASERLLRRRSIVRPLARRASEPAALPGPFQKLEGEPQSAQGAPEITGEKPILAPSAPAEPKLAMPQALARPSTSSSESSSGWSEAVTASGPPSPSEDRSGEDLDIFYDALENQPQETLEAQEEVSQAGSAPSVPEAEERPRVEKESTAASEDEEDFEVVPSKEKVREAAEAEEEFSDVFSPDEMAALLKSPEGCEQWVRQLTPMLKMAWRSCPFYCAIWTLFNRDGRLSTPRDDMLMLAAQLSSKVNAARELDPERQDVEAQRLRMQLSLAEAQEDLVKARSTTERECWFAEAKGVYAHAEPHEIEILNSAASASAAAMHPRNTLEQLSRLINLAAAHVPGCIVAAEAEKGARSTVQATLRREKERIEHFLEEAKETISPIDTLRAKALTKDLQLLEQREACSIEMVLLLEDQVNEIERFIRDYKAKGGSWWIPQLVLRVRRCLRKNRNSRVVPPSVASDCRKFEGSSQPVSPDKAAPDLLWFWEAAEERLETQG